MIAKQLQQVFFFQEGHAGMKELLGGKGANLAEMTRVGLPVPPGFTISTEACRVYFAEGGRLSDALLEEMTEAMRRLEAAKGQRFGDPANPLLVSVRSGSVTSMPGMMDTILNVGLNDRTVEGLAALTGDARFAYDCYRRLMQMFGSVVFGIELLEFERLLHRMKVRAGVESDQQVTAEDWKALVAEYKKVYRAAEGGREFPQSVEDQLRLATEAVFRSWHNERAAIYRRIHQIPDSQGTAVNIQSMVFGNMGDDCGTGVLFTRNPSTGEKVLYGEYLINAQGEDVVAGVRTPQPIASLAQDLPEVYANLIGVAAKLEAHYQDMQDIEFTVERSKLYILQTRNGKRTAQAAVRIAVELAQESVIAREEALLRIEPIHLDQLLHRGLDEQQIGEVLTTGLPASPGAAAGHVVFDADTAAARAAEGMQVVLARPETTPEDIRGMLAAQGILTCRGGMTSHAAVVARGMGKPCVSGCEELHIDEEARLMSVGSRVIREGDWITLDGASGRIIVGEVPLREAEMTPELADLLQWADEVRTLRVLANADHPGDAQTARKFGGEGIGLCRTEHMFFAEERLPVVRRMILADDKPERMRALELLLPMQQADFEGLFEAMDGFPVTIRLLDPPLHEFLPQERELREQLAQLDEAAGSAGQGAVGGVETDAAAAADRADKERERLQRLIRKVRELTEVNPMLGHRGCRLGIVYPEIYEMQAEAIFRAADNCIKRGIRVLPEIMIPLVGHTAELKLMREVVDAVAVRVLGETAARDCPYRVGTMIEVPRAAITARQIADYADFFSFGTNDLTQMTYGYSRDDAEGKFLNHYLDRKLLPENPFQVLDREGVGRLIEWAVAEGRSAKPALKTGICGEHGGDKSSIHYCQSIGLDYVSCSPYRIPLARIAAAQAAILQGRQA